MNRRLVQWLAVAVGVAIVLHVAIVWAVPRVIMSVAIKRIGNEGALNAFTHSPRTTHEFRAVVRPSPDLAYSICVLDLSDGPVTIEVPASDPYTSLALYSSITDNYFVRNNRQDGGLRRRRDDKADRRPRWRHAVQSAGGCRGCYLADGQGPRPCPPRHRE